jgi:hypothetical protein
MHRRNEYVVQQQRSVFGRSRSVVVQRRRGLFGRSRNVDLDGYEDNRNGWVTALFAGIWRAKRLIWALIAIAILLMAASFILPGLVARMLGTAVLWPVYVLGVFAVWAHRRGDRVSYREYIARLRTVTTVNRDVVTKAAALAAVVGLISAITNLVSGDIGIWRALDVAVAVSATLLVATVCVLELLTRNGVGGNTRQVRQDAPTQPHAARQVTNETPGPRARTSRNQSVPATQPKRPDAPGPRSATHRKAL